MNACNDDNKTINQIFHDFKILKLEDFIKHKNITFVKDCLSKIGPRIFHNKFTLSQQRHQHFTRNAQNNFVNIPQVQTSLYGVNSIKFKSATTWNNLQNTLESDLLNKSYPSCKKLLFDFYLTNYSQNT